MRVVCRKEKVKVPIGGELCFKKLLKGKSRNYVSYKKYIYCGLIFCFLGVLASPVQAELSLSYGSESLLSLGQDTPTGIVFLPSITQALVVSSENINTTSNLSLESTPAINVVQQAIEFRLIGPMLNYPNPFSFSKGQTEIGFRISTSAYLTLKVFNLRGQEVYSKEITPTDYGAATYNKIPFSRMTIGGEWLQPGVYIYFLIHEGKILAKNRMMVLP